MFRFRHGSKIAPDHELELRARKLLLHAGGSLAIGAVEIGRPERGQLPVHDRIELARSRRRNPLLGAIGRDDRRATEREEKNEERSLEQAAHRQAARAGSIRRRY